MGLAFTTTGNRAYTMKDACKEQTGLPHSKTLRDELERENIRQVLECGSPVPLLDLLVPVVAVTSCARSCSNKSSAIEPAGLSII